MNQTESEMAHQPVHEHSESDSPTDAKVHSKLPSSPKQTKRKRSASDLKDDTSQPEAVPCKLDTLLSTAITSTSQTAQDDYEIPDLEKKPSAVEVGSKPKKGDQITMPADFDVVFGRGKPFQSHPGNQRLHQIVTLHKDQYQAARRYDKLAIAQQVVDSIKSGGKTPGRFLRRVEGEDGWEIVPDDVAREKVAHALRGKFKLSTGPEETTPKKRRASNLDPNIGNRSHSKQVLPPSSQHQEAMVEFRPENPMSMSSPLAFSSSEQVKNAGPSANMGDREDPWRMMGGGSGINSWGWHPSVSSLFSAQQQQQQQHQLTAYNSSLGIRNLAGGMLENREILLQQLSLAYASQNPSVPLIFGTGMGALMPNPPSANSIPSQASFMMPTSAAAIPSNDGTSNNASSNLDVAIALLAQEREIARRRAAIERALRRDPSSGDTTGASNGDASGDPSQQRFPRFF
jgi:hypothetical protein